MRTMFDLADREIASLSEDDVKRYCDIQLMTDGVVQPVKPKDPGALVSPRLPPKTYWGIEFKWRDIIVFEDPESAKTFLALNPSRITYDHNIGDEYKYAEPIEQSIQNIQLYNYDDMMAVKNKLVQWKADKTVFEQESKVYSEAIKQITETTAPVWKKWHECRRKLSHYQTIIRSLNEYLSLCNGDRDIAMNFLKKAFTEEEIATAFEWIP